MQPSLDRRYLHNRTKLFFINVADRRVGCVFLVIFIDFVCPMVSCWLLVLISFARYTSIVYPLRAKVNKKKYGLACALIWLVASIWNTHTFMSRTLQRVEGVEICVFDFKNNVIQIFVSFIFNSFIPLTLMLFLYHKMKKRMNIRSL